MNVPSSMEGNGFDVGTINDANNSRNTSELDDGRVGSSEDWSPNCGLR